MQKLPIGIQSFEDIRKENYLYVDKTKQILKMIENGKCYFFSRPRRFGKSLTISTLEAMFKGEVELFKGLYAEEWVKEQAKNPNPVISLDMGCLKSYESIDLLNHYLVNQLKQYLFLNDLEMPLDENADIIFSNLIIKLYKEFGQVVVLIDEYDKTITDNINDLNKAEEMRRYLRSFYSVLKSNSKYLRFVILTGVSKFSKSGVFSGLNNLQDISMKEDYGDIVGYTQKELEDNFGEWIEKASQKLLLTNEELLQKIKRHYDGFSFDGKVRVYNPYSILNFFSDQEFNNYWYNSATPSFLADYLKTHQIDDINEFRHLKVPSDFANEHEIEKSTPESFLFQAGYLTIEKKESKESVTLTLDYPNEEVKKSISRLFLQDIYKIRKYKSLGDELWESVKALNEGNIENIVDIFNNALEKIPYNDFPKNKNEYWYRSLFVMLLRGGAGVSSFQESYTKDGRSDLVIPFDDKIIIIDFKFANTSKEVDKKRLEGEEQVKQYAKTYENEGKKIITVVLVADNRKRKVVI